MDNNKQNNSTDKNNLDQLFNKFNNKKNVGQDANPEATNPAAKTTTARANASKGNSNNNNKSNNNSNNNSKAKTNNNANAKAETNNNASNTANTTNSANTTNNNPTTNVKANNSNPSSNSNVNVNSTTNNTTANASVSVDKDKIELPKKELNKKDIQKDIELDLARAKNDAEKAAAKDKLAQDPGTDTDKAKQKAKEDLDRVARGTNSLANKNTAVTANDNKGNNNGNNNGNGASTASEAVAPTYGSKRNKLVAALAVLGLCLAGYSVYQVKTLNIDKKLEQYTATTVKAVQTTGTTANNNLQEIASLKAQIATLQAQLNDHSNGIATTGNNLSEVNNQQQALQQKVSDLEKSVLANNAVITSLGNQVNNQAKELTAEQQQLVTDAINNIIHSDEYKEYLHNVIFTYLKANPEADPSSVANLSKSTVDQIVDLVKTKLKATFDENTAALVEAQKVSANAQSLATEAHNTAAQSKADASQAQYVADKALAQAEQSLSLSKQAQTTATTAQDQATQSNNQAANALAQSQASLDLVQSTVKSTKDILAQTTKELQDQAQQVSSELKSGLENNEAQVSEAVAKAKTYAQSILATQYLEEAHLLIKNNAPVYQVINKLSVAYDLAKSPELENTILADINHFQDLPFNSADEFNQAQNELNQLSNQAQDLPSLDATKFTSNVTKDASAFDKGVSSFINKFITVNKSSDSDLLRENAGILINQQIQLKLSQTVIALQNNNSELYHSSLSNVEHLLTTYYPSNNKVVTDLLTAVKKFNSYDFTYKGYTLISVPVNN